MSALDAIGGRALAHPVSGEVIEYDDLEGIKRALAETEDYLRRPEVRRMWNARDALQERLVELDPIGLPRPVRQTDKQRKVALCPRCRSDISEALSTTETDSVRTSRARAHKAYGDASCALDQIGGCSPGKVEIHHIDGDPLNNDPENLFPLCVAHHRLVETGRIDLEDPEMPPFVISGGKRRYLHTYEFVKRKVERGDQLETEQRTTCGGCGAPLDERTPGCAVCTGRHWRRAQKTSEPEPSPQPEARVGADPVRGADNLDVAGPASSGSETVEQSELLPQGQRTAEQDAALGVDIFGAKLEGSEPLPQAAQEAPSSDAPAGEEEARGGASSSLTAIVVQAGEVTFDHPRSRYLGKTVAEVYEIDPTYLSWYIENGLTEVLKAAIITYVAAKEKA